MYSKIIQNHTVNVFPSFLWFVVNVRSFEMDSLQSTLFYSTTKVNRFVWMCSKMSKASKITLWMLFSLICIVCVMCHCSFLWKWVYSALFHNRNKMCVSINFNEFQNVPKHPKPHFECFWCLKYSFLFFLVNGHHCWLLWKWVYLGLFHNRSKLLFSSVQKHIKSQF